MVKAIIQAFHDREIGPARMYQLCLLLKKLCVFLSSTQSVKTNQMIMPQSIPAYSFIQSLCEETTKQRKMLQYDRSILAITKSKDGRTKSKSAHPTVHLTSEDLQTIVTRGLSHMDQLRVKRSAKTTTNDKQGLAKEYTNNLITVSFVLLLGPRQQVFRS